MKNIFLSILLFVGTLSVSQAQKEISYTVSFPNAVHHEAEISMTIPAVPAGSLKVRMSRSSAGRYATHEFGKNIYNVKAFDGNGKELSVKQTEGDVYEISKHGDKVKVTYTLFANWTDGTYASVDPSHAHLNMPATIMWAIGMENRPIYFQFKDTDKYGWKIATQLKPESNNSYFAPNLQYMMDSPTELSAYKENRWQISNPDGKKLDINLTIHSNDGQPVIDNFAKMVQKVVLEEQAVFGELPVYDYGSYTFLDDVYPTNSGDGMEHRNSTCIVQTADKVEGNEQRLLGTYAHEYFHSWNVKHIRPKTLEPFNFEHANMSSELWFAEGFTQYYGEMLLVRAGFHTPEEYCRTIAGLVNTVLNAAPSAKYPATQMSRYAVFADAGVSIDPNNNSNIFTSYYTYGGAIALALDLRLRSDYHLTLDDSMREIWLTVGKVMKPYTIPDLEHILAKVTKDEKFAANFFSKYIYGLEKNDYAMLLSKAGLLLRKAQPGKGWIGNFGGGQGRGRAGQTRTSGTTGVPINISTASNTPVYKAGIDAGDILLTADGKTLANAGTLNEMVSAKKPVDHIVLTYSNRMGQHETTVQVEENPLLEVVTFESANQTLTPQQSAFRKSWLSSKAK